MFRYIAIALVLHGLLFLKFNNTMTLGDPSIGMKRNVPISVNTKNKSERIDSLKKEKAGVKEATVEEVSEAKVEKKVEKEIKSKMSKNKKKEEKKKEEKPKKSKKKKSNKKQNSNKKKAKKSTENQQVDPFAQGGNFTSNADGSYTAISSRGINFEIISQPDPEYPRAAEAIRYSKTVIVEAKFLVGLNGRVEDIIITKSFKKFGFDKEVISALKKWKFKPIYFEGKNIKVYFNKEFVFSPKS